MTSVLAEAVVGKVRELGVQQVANQVSLVVNFTQDFEWLNNIIEQINYFLNEADERHTAQKESVKKWLQSVRDIAWQAEDILEECSVESMYRNITPSCSLSCNIFEECPVQSIYRNITEFCVLSCNQLVVRHKMGRQIKNVKARMSSIVEEGNRLLKFHALVSPVEEPAASSSTSQTEQTEQFKRTSLLPPDSLPVGIQSKVESIVSFLDDPAHPIIAVVGMGGMGKTYLLQHVFNSTNDRYERSIWLSVSQFYSVSKLQYDIASHLGLSGEIKDSGVSEQRAAVLIHDKLQRLITEDKRCLIVLDDVWRATREDNLIARLGLPTGNNRSCKIVVTTRSMDVCLNMNAKIYNMEFLSDENSWRLFCVYAFQKFEENRPPRHLEEVGREIVKECGKLPLAIKTIAASLANTTLRNKWESKLSQLKKVATPNDPIMDILKLSYNSLPAGLKACFAYLSFFPEDREIECEYLISLWIGEGFIPSGEEQWDKAWDCLYQLANLCLLEVWEDIHLNKSCKIHDLLLDLAIYISRENKCALDVGEAFPSMDRSGGSCRRIILGKKDVDDGAISQSRPVRPTLLRTLSLGDNEKIRNIPASFFSSMRVLRVLDLSSTNISTLPGCVGKMKLLKVLNLRQTQIKEVPGCVRHLKSLCFLDISRCRQLVSNASQRWISELKCLQHLHCSFTRMPKGISKMVSLRTLRSEYLDLSIQEDELLRLEDVGNMTQLQELWLNVNHESELKRVEEGIFARLVKMRRLHIRNKIPRMQGEIPHFPETVKSMEDVETLRVQRFAVPSWICCLANLRQLHLTDCDCSNYPELQTMHNLVRLVLEGNARCRELPKAFGKSGGFPQLRILEIGLFPDLEEFPELEDGAMACLEQFLLWSCAKVKKVGEGLERLKRLKEFDYI